MGIENIMPAPEYKELQEKKDLEHWKEGIEIEKIEKEIEMIKDQIIDLLEFRTKTRIEIEELKDQNKAQDSWKKIVMRTEHNCEGLEWQCDKLKKEVEELKEWKESFIEGRELTVECDCKPCKEDDERLMVSNYMFKRLNNAPFHLTYHIGNNSIVSLWKDPNGSGAIDAYLNNSLYCSYGTIIELININPYLYDLILKKIKGVNNDIRKD